MEYPNTGSLMPSTTRYSEKSPDLWGDIKIEKALLKELMDQSDGGLVTIKLSAWKRSSKSGNRFLSLAVNTSSGKKQATQENEKDEWDI